MNKFPNIPLFIRHLKLLAFSLAILIWSTVSQAAGLSAVHNLRVELVPAEMKLIGIDDITVKTGDVKNLAFRFSEKMSHSIPHYWKKLLKRRPISIKASS